MLRRFFSLKSAFSFLLLSSFPRFLLLFLLLQRWSFDQRRENKGTHSRNPGYCGLNSEKVPLSVVADPAASRFTAPLSAFP